MTERPFVPRDPELAELPEPEPELLAAQPPVWQPPAPKAGAEPVTASPAAEPAPGQPIPTARHWQLPALLLAVVLLAGLGAWAKAGFLAPSDEAAAGPTVADLQQELAALRETNQAAQASHASQVAEAFARLRTEHAPLKDMLTTVSQRLDALDQRLTAQVATQATKNGEQDQRLSDFVAWQEDVKKRLAARLQSPVPAKVIAAQAGTVPAAGRVAAPALRPPFELLSVDSWNLSAYAAIRPEGSSEVKFLAVGERFAGWQFDAVSLASQTVDVYSQGVRLTLSARR